MFTTMNRFLSLFLVSVLSVGLFQVASAQNTASQSVTINVAQITTLDVSGGGITFDFASSDATAGSGTASLTKSRSYSIFTNVPTNGNGGGVKITGSLGSGFASGITLKANLNAPSTGGSSQGLKSLSATDTDLVTTIGPTSEGSLSINYTAKITPSAAPNSGSTETVTYTVTAQ